MKAQECAPTSIQVSGTALSASTNLRSHGSKRQAARMAMNLS